jgi:hypothetical protein
MTAPIKTYTATIETDSGIDRVLQCIDAKQLAKDVLELAAHVDDATGIGSDDAVMEEICRQLLGWGAEIQDGEIYPNQFGDSFSDFLHDMLQDAVRASQAAQDYMREADEYGYSLDQHEADERAMLEVL